MNENDPPVLVRTYSAGIHFGVLLSLNGTTGVLWKSRRIRNWTEAFTLTELTTHGGGYGSGDGYGNSNG